MGGTKGKNLKTPKSVKCPASISKNPVPLFVLMYRPVAKDGPCLNTQQEKVLTQVNSAIGQRNVAIGH